MSNFETTILISPDLSESDLIKIEDSFNKLISENDGKIIGKESWGLRNLAYIIDEKKKAYYNYYQITIEGSKIDLIKKNLTLNEKIIRYLFIKVDNHDQLPTKMTKGND